LRSYGRSTTTNPQPTHRSLWRRPQDVGSDPDPRFTFANERTFLAWNRTALALLAAGVAVSELLDPSSIPGGRRLLGLPLIVLGAVVGVGSYVRWLRSELALRLARSLPASRLPMLMAAAVALAAVGAAAVVISGK
jgi:putative membrane protein